MAHRLTVQEPFLVNPPKRVRRYAENPGMEAIMLLNPPKKGKKTVAKKKTAAKKSDTKKPVVRRKKKVARRKSPVTSLRRHAIYQTNPPKKHRRKRVRRNPPGMGMKLSSVVPILKEGLFLAVGSVAVTQVMARVPYVQTLVGMPRQAARLAVSIIGGTLIGKYLNKEFGKAFALGGVLTTVNELGQENLPSVFGAPGLPTGTVSEYYAGGALSEYYAGSPALSDQPDGLNYGETDLPERLNSSGRF